MYGMGDVAHTKNEQLEAIKKKLKMWGATVLMTKVSMSVNEIFALHNEIVEMIEDIQNTC